MTPDERKGLVRRLTDELWNKGNLDVCDEVFAAHWTMGGTSRGEFRGLPATGKTYVMTGMTIDKWEGERIVEEWTNYDLLGGLQQLGIIPEMARQETTG